jgi:sterol 3beta-glucosyltransferase
MVLLCGALMDAGPTPSVGRCHDARLRRSSRCNGDRTRWRHSQFAAAGHDARKKGNFRNTAGAFARIATAHSEEWLRTTIAAAEGCDAVLLDGLAAFGGLSAAEALGFPAIGTGLIPITPTRDFASPFLRRGILPHWPNRRATG